MSEDEQFEEIELDLDYQKNLTMSVVELGKSANAHPIKFVLAIISAAQIICEHENLQLEDLVALLNEDHETSSSLH